MSAQPGAGAVRVRLGSAADVARVAPLWRDFYAGQQAMGLVASVPPNGFELWAAAQEPILGRFGCLVVADVGERCVGFTAGRIRNLPKHLGGDAAGYISEVYVAPEARGSGTGRALMEETLRWFASQRIQRVELQVLPGNDAARTLYRRLGFVDDLVQMVRVEETARPDGAA